MNKSFLPKIISHSLTKPPKLNMQNMIKYKSFNPDSRARIVHSELKHRLGYKVMLLENLPYGLGRFASIKTVQNWYLQSYKDLINFEENSQINNCEEYNNILKNILKRHSPTLINMSKGIFEWKKDLDERYGRVDKFYESKIIAKMTNKINKDLNTFYEDRVSTRLIINHHLSLCEDEQICKNINTKNNYVGIINLNTNPIEILRNAYENAKSISDREYGFCPELRINDTDLYEYFDNEKYNNIIFPYIPSHMYHMFFEILKNSIRATIEDKKNCDPINIYFSEDKITEDNHFSMKISDTGCGINKKKINNIWSYFYTTAPKNVLRVKSMEEINDFDQKGPIAGFGYGLPISRLLMRYFNGEITINSIRNVGTDVNMYF